MPKKNPRAGRVLTEIVFIERAEDDRVIVTGAGADEGKSDRRPKSPKSKYRSRLKTKSRAIMDGQERDVKVWHCSGEH